MVIVFGALSYGELAAMFPETGGLYVYLREGISPLFGYLYGWTLFGVIQTGAIAAVGVAFARFAGGPLASAHADRVPGHDGPSAERVDRDRTFLAASAARSRRSSF